MRQVKGKHACGRCCWNRCTCWKVASPCTGGWLHQTWDPCRNDWSSGWGSFSRLCVVHLPMAHHDPVLRVAAVDRPRHRVDFCLQRMMSHGMEEQVAALPAHWLTSSSWKDPWLRARHHHFHHECLHLQSSMSPDRCLQTAVLSNLEILFSLARMQILSKKRQLMETAPLPSAAVPHK
ncbi:uncharacterized protein LOC125758963 [Rhipicephalus sanguineus]|uniref:uncharacterized protein LOC125758963 n=1 Tax=Rhipicephalus sanguineus TaxID=34632 RepID=UPI0020C553B6|nr:uncharacterized protein LOC125758963 [Rhipicephalus sanguineus]